MRVGFIPTWATNHTGSNSKSESKPITPSRNSNQTCQGSLGGSSTRLVIGSSGVQIPSLAFCERDCASESRTEGFESENGAKRSGRLTPSDSRSAVPDRVLQVATVFGRNRSLLVTDVGKVLWSWSDAFLAPEVTVLRLTVDVRALWHFCGFFFAMSDSSD